MEVIKRKKIPKLIHFIWFGKQMPFHVKNRIRNIKRLYKDYKVKIWGEDDFDPNIVKYTRVAKKEKKWAFISDYLRVKILYEYGGVYLDTDMEPVDDMRNIINSGSVILGFEYSKMVTTGFAASVPKHPLMKQIMDVYDAFDFIEEEKVMFIINNEIWTYFLVKIYGLKTNNKEQELMTDIKIYPMSYFSEFNAKENSIFLHKHQLSWTSRRKAKAMSFSLQYLIRPFQTPISYLLEFQKGLYFRKNKKIIKNQTKSKKEFEKEIQKLIETKPNQDLLIETKSNNESKLIETSSTNKSKEIKQEQIKINSSIKTNTTFESEKNNDKKE